MNKKEINIDYRCYANSHLPRYYIVSRIEYDFESGGWYSQVDVAKLEKNKQAIKYGTLADAKKHAESIYMQYKDKYGVDMRIVIIDELIDVDSLNKNINKLENQLAEKDKEIERLKKILHLLLNDEHIHIWTDVYDTKGNVIGERAFNEEDKAMIYSLNKLKTETNQKAIEELEKLKEEKFEGKCKVWFDEARHEFIINQRDKEIIDYLDERIKKLKGE